MTVFQDTTDFSRGEVDPALYSRQDAEFYATAAKKLDNLFPDRVGGAFKRPLLSPAYGLSPSFPPLPKSALYLLHPLSPNFGTRTLPNGIDYSSRDMMIKVVSLVGQDYLLLVERMFASDLIGDTSGNAVIYTVVKIDAEMPYRLDVSLQASKVFYFDNPEASTALEKGFPDNVFIFSGNNYLRASTPRLQHMVRVSTAGPTAFITTGRMDVVRVFIDSDNAVQIETVQFYEELVGTVAVEQNSPTVTGTDTIFTEQLAVGSVVDIEGEFLTVQTVNTDLSFTATADFTGLSQETRAAVQNAAPFGVDQFPNQVAFFQNRLALAATVSKPTGIWVSKANNPFWILPGNVTPESPIAQEIFLPGATRFRWMTATNRLYLGSSDGEFAVGDPDTVLTPTTFTASRIGTTGSSRANVEVTDANFINVGRTGKRLFAVQFDFARQAFASSDITFLVPHLFQSDVVEVSYRPATLDDPTNRLFVVQEDGSLRGCSYSPDQNILGWSRNTIDNQRNHEALSVTNSREYVFVLFWAGVFARSVGLSASAYHLACFRPMQRTMSPSLVGRLRMDFEYSDTFGVYPVPAFFRQTTVSVVNGPGKYVGEYDVPADGTWDDSFIPNPVDRIAPYTIGYQFDATVELLPSATSDNRGSNINRKRRLVRTLVDLYQTDQARINGLEVISTLAQAPEGHTGVYSKRFLGWGYRDETKLEILGRDLGRIRSVTREVSA